MLRRNWWKLTFAVLPAIAVAMIAFPVSAQDKPTDPKKPAEPAKPADKPADKPKDKPADKPKDDKAGKTIVDTAKEHKNLSKLVGYLNEAGLAETLKGAGPFTLFAPTDEAFAKIKKEDLEAWTKDKAKLTSLLKNHVVAGKHDKAAVEKMKEAKTMTGTLTVSVKDGKIIIGSATVTTADVSASNGVIHVIDTVQVPAEKKPAPPKEEPKPATPPPAPKGG